MKILNDDLSVELNRYIHDSVAHLYGGNHPDIFNFVEQDRIKSKLTLMGSYLHPASEVLDFGCGSGNLTRHLLNLGYSVTSADISAKFLEIVREQFVSNQKHKTYLLTGNPNADLLDLRFDAICIYSVLHHIPDYIHCILMLIKLLKPGGIIYIDHESSPDYWKSQSLYSDLQRRSRLIKLILNYGKIFKFKWYKDKVNTIFNPRYQPEGDIHVWPDDHIEWDIIDYELSNLGFVKLHSEDYLLFKNFYRLSDYDHYRTKVSDMRVSFYMAPQQD